MFPVDSITGPTRCKLYVPAGKGAFKIEVASGMAYPGRLWHGNLGPPPSPPRAADMVHANAMDCKLDFPTPDTEIDTLGGAKNEFILWPRRDITLEGHVRAQIQQLEPVQEQQDPQSLEPQLPLVPAPPAPHPPRTAPEQRTSGSAPSIGSPPPARQIIPYTEMSVVVQGWDTTTKGKQLKQLKKSQKGKGKAKGKGDKSQLEQLNTMI